MLKGGPFPVAHSESFATCRDGNRVALWIQLVTIEVVNGRDKFAVALRAYAGQFDIQATPGIGRGIEQVQVCASVVDQALSIAGHMTRIKVVMIGVAAYILALRRAGIDVSDPIIIREDIDALAHPARAGDIAIQLQQALERSTARGVAP